MSVQTNAPTAEPVGSDADDLDDAVEEQEPDLPPQVTDLWEWMDESVHLSSSRRGRLDRTWVGSLHPMYEDGNIHAETKHAAMRAWLDGRFPLPAHESRYYHREHARSPLTVEDGRVATEIRCSSWMGLYQFPDGSGKVTYGSNTHAIRTAGGMLLVTSEDIKLSCGSWWFGSYNHPPSATVKTYKRVEDDSMYRGYRREVDEVIHEPDHIIPLNSIEEMDGTPPLYDIVEVEEGEESDWNGPRIAYVHFEDGTTVVVLTDDSATNRDDVRAGFIAEDGEPLPPVDEAEQLLMPERVRMLYQNGWEIVTSDEFRQRGDYDWQNEVTGGAIIRQGEFYLVPKDDDWSPDNPVKKCLPVANRKVDWDYSHLSDGPQQAWTAPECRCGATRWNVDSRKPFWACKECDTSYLYDNGKLYPTKTPVSRPEYQETQDEILGSHVPRDLSFDEAGRPVVRGTFRHVDNEHTMLNVDDHWHEVHDNTRDVTVFSMRRGRYASGGTGSGMRME